MNTLLICVGTGGIFYHGLSRMATFCHRRGDTEIVLIDPDIVEKKNTARQWGTGIGKAKVDIAKQVLVTLGIEERKIEPYAIHLDDSHMLQAVLWHNHIKLLDRIVVVSTPDNHLCRVNVHEGCKILALRAGTKTDIIEITAGNSLTRGYAYGCTHHALNKNTEACYGNWSKRHPDIINEAEEEKEGLAHPMPCGGLESPVGEVEQSMESNMLTALCVWDLAEMMAVDGVVGEMLWADIEEKLDTGVRKHYTKVWSNIVSGKRGKK